jgi:hypothetical protein
VASDGGWPFLAWVVHREVLWSPGGGVAHARRFVTYF